MIKKYDVTLKFLRKALQYAWYLGLPEVELVIYDRMGVINYLSGDILKARYYHDRFMLKRLEANKSPCRLSSAEILRKTFEMNDEENWNIYSASPSQVFPMILAKLSISLDNGNVFSRKSIFKPENQNDRIKFFYNINKSKEKGQSVEFFTELSCEHQLEQILEEKEFGFEIASPRCFYSIVLDSNY